MLEGKECHGKKKKKIQQGSYLYFTIGNARCNFKLGCQGRLHRENDT